MTDTSPSVGLGLRGHDGDGALDRSLAERGHDRRTFLRGSLAGAAGVGLTGAGLGALPAHAGLRPTGRPLVPASLINDTPDVSPLQTAEVGYRYLRTLRF